MRASLRACCRARAARCHSGTSSPASRSSSRSGRTGARSCTARILEALRNPPEGALPDPAQLAYHAEAAGNARAVLHYATAAGKRAASQGAHREAAAQFARALRFAGSLSPAELGELFERQAHELYLTNWMDDAVAAQQRALAVLSRARRSPQ